MTRFLPANPLLSEPSIRRNVARPAAGGIRSTWIAVAWASGLTVLGLALVLGALLSQIEWCVGSLGCEQESFDPEAILVLGLGFVALAGAPVQAARVSGWPLWFGVGVLAGAAFLVTLVIGGIVLAVIFDNVLPALVVALAAEGVIAIRPPVRSARIARFVVVGVLVLLAAGFAQDNSGAGIVALVLLTFPAIGLADAIAWRIERRPAPRWPS